VPFKFNPINLILIRDILLGVHCPPGAYLV
jgi:hypothetical protein